MKKRNKLKIALVGNPNSGKTTLFNSLTKSIKKTGNYPGVTIEKQEGFFSYNDQNFSIIDLPGSYSLTSNSLDEKITRDFIINEKPDLILNVIDSSQLERSLFLTTQLIELEQPILLVCNKIDLAKTLGISIDFKKLEDRIEIPTCPIMAVKKEDIDLLKKKIFQLTKHQGEKNCSGVFFKMPQNIEDAIFSLRENLTDCSRFKAIKLLEDEKYFNEIPLDKTEIQIVTNTRGLLLKTCDNIKDIIVNARMSFAQNLCTEIELIQNQDKLSFSDKIDRFIINKYLSIPIFLTIMYLVFQFTFSFGGLFSKALSFLFTKASLFITNIWQSESLIKSLVTDGIINGVGSVLSLLPYILCLFVAISILEESGYMARAAYVMDRIMHRMGLHGKSFLPMIIGFGCSVPAIMTTRILENRKNRLTTILILPLIACSGKLAVFTLILPAFFSSFTSTVLLFSMYIFGIALAIVLIKILRKTIFKGENIPFILELPTYQVPRVFDILKATWEKGKLYVKKAGSFILSISIILWFLSVFPINKSAIEKYNSDFSAASNKLSEEIFETIEKPTPSFIKKEILTQITKAKDTKGFILNLSKNSEIKKYLKNKNRIDQIEILEQKYNSEISSLKNNKNKALLKHSFIGRIGRSLSPIFSPIGFDWKINTAVLSALAAKEIFISQLSIIFSGDNLENATLKDKLAAAYSPLQGICIIIFLLISMPCIATTAMVKKETNSCFWPIFQFISLTALAYLITLLIYQIGS